MFISKKDDTGQFAKEQVKYLQEIYPIKRLASNKKQQFIKYLKKYIYLRILKK